MKILWAGIGLLAFATSAFAQLDWEQRLIDIKASPADAKAVARFEFQNAGDKTVTISSLNSSCGCTTAKLEKKNYDPGEKGEVVATFEFKERVGQQEKTILVSSDDSKEPTVALTLRVLIPELVKITPAVVTWETENDSKPKSVQIEVLEEGKVKIHSVHSENPNIRAQLKEIRPGKEYEVLMEPKDMSQRLESIVQVEGEVEGEKAKVFPIYAKIRSQMAEVGHETVSPKRESLIQTSSTNAPALPSRNQLKVGEFGYGTALRGSE